MGWDLGELTLQGKDNEVGILWGLGHFWGLGMRQQSKEDVRRGFKHLLPQLTNPFLLRLQTSPCIPALCTQLQLLCL